MNTKKITESSSLDEAVRELIRGIKLELDDAVAELDEDALRKLSDSLDNPELVKAVVAKQEEPSADFDEPDTSSDEPEGADA